MDPRTQAMLNQLRGAPEATATLLSGMVAEPLAGLHGAGQGIISLLRGRGASQAAQDAAGRVESTREALTYQPRSQSGQEALQGLGRTMEPVARALEAPADWLGENVSPEAGASLAGLAAVVDPTKGAGRAAKAVRRTAEETRAGGWRHPVLSEKKVLSVPWHQMTSTRRANDVPMLPEQIINPDQIPLGTRIVPRAWDRSDAGFDITSIGGRELADPVRLHGGNKFMRTHGGRGIVSASNLEQMSGLQNFQRELEGLGDAPIWMTPVGMGATAMDFNTMMSDALLEQIRAGKLKKSDIADFDRALREGTEAGGGRPEWLGLMHPGARAQLDANGALRVPFVNRMQLDRFQEAGFPAIDQTRMALLDPAMLHDPLYSGGRTFGELMPGGRYITDPEAPHPTYPVQYPGQYRGGFGVAVPRQEMFPTFHAQRRAAGELEAGDQRSFQLSNVYETVTPEWQDRMSRLVEQLRQRGPEVPYAAGGAR